MSDNNKINPSLNFVFDLKDLQLDEEMPFNINPSEFETQSRPTNINVVDIKKYKNERKARKSTSGRLF